MWIRIYVAHKMHGQLAVMTSLQAVAQPLEAFFGQKSIPEKSYSRRQTQYNYTTATQFFNDFYEVRKPSSTHAKAKNSTECGEFERWQTHFTPL